MLVYLHYDEGENEDLHVTIKFTVPKSWYDEKCEKIIEAFVEFYNGKIEKKLKNRSDNTETDSNLDWDSIRLKKEEICLNNRSCDRWMTGSDIIRDSMEKKNDLYMKPLSEKPETSSSAPGSGTGSSSSSSLSSSSLGIEKDTKNASSNLVQCQNYGCNKTFIDDEEHNTNTSCKHHVAPPVFHDCKKGWKCCKKRVYDWDEFHLIEGCHVGKHSTEKPQGDRIANSPNYIDNNNNGMTSSLSTDVKVKSIEDFNKANPNAVSATDEIEQTKKKLTQSTRKEDGTATCLNKGCQKNFLVAENNPNACTYHSKEPVFHDTVKYWSCCPENVSYDFDAFLAIPGCTVGWHNDGHKQTNL